MKEQEYEGLKKGMAVRHKPTGFVSRIFDLRLVGGKPVDRKVLVSGMELVYWNDLEPLPSQKPLRCQYCDEPRLVCVAGADDVPAYIDGNPDMPIELENLKLQKDVAFPEEFLVCMSCGRIQGKWPAEVDLVEHEQALKLKEKYNL